MTEHQVETSTVMDTGQSMAVEHLNVDNGSINKFGLIKLDYFQ